MTARRGGFKPASSAANARAPAAAEPRVRRGQYSTVVRALPRHRPDQRIDPPARAPRRREATGQSNAAGSCLSRAAAVGIPYSGPPNEAHETVQAIEINRHAVHGVELAKSPVRRRIRLRRQRLQPAAAKQGRSRQRRDLSRRLRVVRRLDQQQRGVVQCAQGLVRCRRRRPGRRVADRRPYWPPRRPG